MPYLQQVITGHEAVKEFLMDWAAEDPTRCSSVKDEAYRDVVRLEHHCSSFSDPGKDYNEYRLFGADGNLIQTIHKEGF